MTAPATMMALRAHARGGAEQLVFEQAPVPVPGPGDALVEVHAAGITFAELTWDLSWTTRDGRDRTPVIPSHEVSGVVRGLGENARGLSIGEEVYGLIAFDRNGAAADYVTAPAADLADRPRSVSHAQAASLPLAALTAWQALTDHADLQPGERVLVRGGAGGVGVYAVQLAAILGADVTATGRAGQGDARNLARLGSSASTSRPARQASAITGTRPARGARSGSSYVAWIFARSCNNRTREVSSRLGTVVASGTLIVPVQRVPFAPTRPVGPLFTRWIEAQCPGDRPRSM